MMQGEGKRIGSNRRIRLTFALIAVLVLVASLAGCGSSEGTGSLMSSSALIETTDATIRFFEERVKADPADFVSYNKLADLYIRRARQTGDMTDYTRAEAALESSLVFLPVNNYEANAQLALVHAFKHQFTDALGMAQKAIATDPSKAFGYGVLGDAQIALGEYEQAFEAYNRDG